MRKACLVVAPPYTDGQIFNRENSRLNRDGCLDFFYYLKLKLAERGYDLDTSDRHSIESSELVIYNEMPKVLPSKSDRKKSVLFIFESELIRPDNWNLDSHQSFDQIFTWHDGFVDRKKYFKFNFTHSGRVPFLKFAEKEKSRKNFCTLIAGNKSCSHALELYSKRVQIIRFFETHYPEYFEFYGVGWDKYTFSGGLWTRVLNRFSWLRKKMAPKFDSYRGMVDKKLECLQRFKFSICYENAREIPGYITEKIFDSMAAGCVPVYWGAPNIEQYVPRECFIDRREFKTDEELVSYLLKMPASEYDTKLSAIDRYLESQSHRLFEAESVAETVANDLVTHAQERSILSSQMMSGGTSAN